MFTVRKISMGDQVETLRREVERLTAELDQTSAEKVQSAQYGLVLLEEKDRLESRCSELEAAFEDARHELQVLLFTPLVAKRQVRNKSHN